MLAEYFDNGDLQGTPKLSRAERRPIVENLRDDAMNAAAIPASGYSIRWTGTLTPPVTGEYTFSAQGQAQGTRIFIDRQQSTKRELVGGRQYAFRVEYRPLPGRGGSVTNSPMQVQWLPPMQPLLAQAISEVKKSDVTIAFVGLNPRLEGEEMNVDVPGFKGGDRTSIDLPMPQERLERDVALLRAALAR